MSLDCWIGSITFEFCCTGDYGVGNPVCWDGLYTWDKCCFPEIFQHFPQDVWETVPSEPVSQDDASDLFNSDVPRDAFVGHFYRRRACMEEYDNWNYRTWFLAQSGVPTTPLHTVGNPGACLGGGHTYWWVDLQITQGIIDVRNGDGDFESSSVTAVLRDLEFGMCLPKSCDYGITELIMMPFFAGPYLGKPWGPNPIALDLTQKAVEEGVSSFPRVMDWAKTIYNNNGYIQTHWPFPARLWKYESSWMPSNENLLVMFVFVFPLLVSCVCEVLAGTVRTIREAMSPLSQQSSSKLGGQLTDSGTQQTISAWRRAMEGAAELFSVRRRLEQLASKRGEDSAGLHCGKVLLQALVCWQHAVLLVEWRGNEGAAGISTAEPWSHGLAQMLGRVNTCFACISAHLTVNSVWSRVKGLSVRQCPVEVLVWCFRRWLSQVVELGVWTFYFVRIWREIPFRPFPEFVQVWYMARGKDCVAWPSGGLPMWLMSSFLVYEPLNGMFGWHRAPSSLCHNLAIFETLFGLSCIMAATLVVRRLYGLHCFVILALLLMALAVGNMSVPNPFDENRIGNASGSWRFDQSILSSAGGGSNWTHDILPTTMSRLLPSSLACGLISVAWASEQGKRLSRWLGCTPITNGYAEGSVGQGTKATAVARRNLLTCLAWLMVMTTFGLDFLMWSQAFVTNNWRLDSTLLKSIHQVWSTIVGVNFLKEREVAPRVLALVTEAPLVVGLAILLHIGQNRRHEGRVSDFVVLLSRLSLSINISNIFVLHYLSGRMHDIPPEFSQVHLFMYASFAWLVASILGLIVHCAAAPYATLLYRIVSAPFQAFFLVVERNAVGATPKQQVVVEQSESVGVHAEEQQQPQRQQQQQQQQPRRRNK